MLIDLQIYMNMDNSSENYWIRLLVREWAQFCIFVYIGYVPICPSAGTFEFFGIY